MESIYSELTLCGSNILGARTDTVFFPISDVGEGTVFLTKLYNWIFKFNSKSLALIALPCFILF